VFDKVLIANRGVIACRIIRTLRRLGIRSVAVYSDADRHARHVHEADEAHPIGPAPARDSYLRPGRILEAARASGAAAIHPGYGFLSENADFAAACAAAGVVFIGPTPGQMRDFGLKHTARALAEAHGVPLLPGTGLLADVDAALAAAAGIGYPLMLKSTAGGGGIGMQRVGGDAELRAAFETVERLARSNFAQGGLFLEKLVEHARHVEVQIFGDGREVVALGERDCSAQRRNQKVVEETPAPGLDDATRARMLEAAVRLGRAVGYRSAGTVEFIYDPAAREFYFLEVNTRLQVEHGVTEEVYGVDLVEWMVREAAGHDLGLGAWRAAPRGHAMQVRIYAEDPGLAFRPSSGRLTHVDWPAGVRVESWVETGSEVSPHYDPMLAKLISHAPDRGAAIDALVQALGAVRLDGIQTNRAWLGAVLADETFRDARHHTRWLAGLDVPSRAIEVQVPGTHTTVQDDPGRTGYWNVGVPPSGPMDSRSFRLGNRLLGNPPDAAGLEITVTGPTLRFRGAARIALTGARLHATLDGAPVPAWTALDVPPGATLRLRGIDGAGSRAYLLVQGGIDVPRYLGSRATFTLGQFGGHGGRALRAGDVLELGETDGDPAGATTVPEALRPQLAHHWDLLVTHGPHGAPDYFLPADIETFFATDWRVHYNSSRTGVRLIGPRPAWARRDGGEAGLHPSNIHDNAYAIGAVDFTGDMPVILGPDGPSLGGFVCPVTVIEAELWKLGQLRPGDTIRFHAIGSEEAVARARAAEASLATLTAAAAAAEPLRSGDLRAVLARHTPVNGVAVTYRRAGDRNLLVEYGPDVLDLELRFRVHALMQAMQQRAIEGVLELTPGIRSLQVHYDSRRITEARLLGLLGDLERGLGAVGDLCVPSRIVHLPLSWDDPATRLAIERYTQSVRADAPWCPSNLEFIRRINGLDSIDEVRRIVFDASYLVMGLGDVYLGAPVATPLDPRHRLVTTKYNPARTWTPENAVGIGGAYLCVYGMEGPGGYQFVGRTLQMWNRDRQTAEFRDGKPWLLRFFDQLRFHPVSAEELIEIREQFPRGRHRLRIEDTTLSLAAYRAFLGEHAGSIATFKARQQAAFEEERERWAATGFDSAGSDPVDDPAPVPAEAVPAGCIAVTSPVTGSVWDLRVTTGAQVVAEQELLIMEAMKMEVPLCADEAALVVELRVAKGRAVQAGETVMVLRPLAAAAVRP
jgi:urea carboxylase